MASIISAGTTSGTALNFTGDTSGVLQVQGTTIGNGGVGTGDSTRFKNRIINGDMRIDQRNGGASLTFNNNTYAVDRFRNYATQSSKGNWQQNAGSVTPPAGFTNYLGFTSSSAYSVADGDYFSIIQKIEGYNFADLAFGTADAKTFTLSFWARSSLTGTFGVIFNNIDLTRSYPATYTISAANTWEYKSITVAGNTSGTWNKTNDTGLVIQWSLGAGSTYSGTPGSWINSEINGVTGATSVVGTNGATLYITGAQLEVGSTASAFEVLDYTTQLSMCLRYYFRETSNMYTSINQASGNYAICMAFPCYMRTSPTMTFDNNGGATASAGDISSTKFSLGYSGSFTASRYTASSEL
jgi:hypothetical protein